MNVRNRIGGARIRNKQVVDTLVLALVETDSEIRFRQGTEVVADFGVLGCHVDKHGAERQLFDELVLVGFQYTHKAEVLRRNLGVEVALQDGVRHLVAKDDEPATAGTKQTFSTALNVLDDALVAFVKDNQNGGNSLEIRHFCHRFLGKELLQGTL